MKTITSICLLALSLSAFSQIRQESYKTTDQSPEWIKYMYTENVNLFTLRSLYENYYSSHEFVKTRHTQYFKRMMKHYINRVDANGYILDEPTSAPIISQTKSPTSPWQEIGPWEYDHEQAMEFQVQSPGSSHIYTVEQSPVNPDHVYAGSATAGLWKSTDKGLNWTLMTRDMDINEVYSIALDPQDVNTIYFGEGNGKIWKSTDGGINWNMTGDASFQSMNSFVRQLQFIAPNTLLAATNSGLFRSTNGGGDWTNVHAGEHMEIELKPNDATTIYTVKLTGDKTEFYKSTDAGITWVLKPTGWPNPSAGDEQKRCEISVTAADPDVVYILASGDVGPDGGLYGIYKSTDAGESFTFSCCDGGAGGAPTTTNPNILGWSEDGTGAGGQYYYDLALGTSPTDPDRLFGAGINVWRSENGGTDWTLNGHWVTWVQSGGLKHRYSHADVHDIKFFQNGSDVDMWVASDGGLYYSSTQGDTLEPRMHGIHGTDFWGWGAGFKEGYVMLGGTYHNGTLIRYNDIYKGGLADPTQGGWLAELGGDNYRGFVNYGDNTIGYSDNGAHKFSPVREERWTGRTFDGDKKCNTHYVEGEYGIYGFSPINYNVMYSPVGNKLYKSINGGVSFEELHSFGGGNVIQVHVGWTNPDIIYVTHMTSVSGAAFAIKKSTDGGATWSTITPSAAETGNNANRRKYIEIDNEDPNKLWCILMGGHTGNKVFQSTDGGASWTNLTTPTIENENIKSISHHYGTNDGLYIGTRKRVYYKNASMADWALFNNNLPASTNCLFLQPYYGEGKIRTASQRGVYECDFYEDAPPVAMAAANQTELNLASDCTPDTIQFVDHSTVRHASGTWQWYFEGGSPATSSLENPKIVYTSPGTYDVKLVVTDAFGTDSVTITDMITITNSYTNQTVVEDFNGTSFPPAGWKLIDSQGSSWEHDEPQNDPTNKVASYPNYWVDAAGEDHLLVMPAMNLTNAQTLNFTFEYTYNHNGSYTDSLEVVYRTAANPTWQSLWLKGGADLAVAGTDTWFWYEANPTINWEMATVDISALMGESCVEIAFANRGNNGNHIWIDNVNLMGTYAGLNTNELMVNVSPNPSNGQFSVHGASSMDEYVVTDLSGRIVQQKTGVSSAHFTLDLSNEPIGIYFLKVNGEGGSSIIKLMKK